LRPMSASPSLPSQDQYGSGGDLRAYLQVIRRRKWSLLLVVLLTVGAAVYFSYRQTPMYRSTATVLVKPLNPNQVLQGYNYNFAVSMQTEQTLATSPDVQTEAQNWAEANGVTSEDTGSVSTSVPTDTTFLAISYSSPDPVQARDWAQAYAEGYSVYRREQAINYYNTAQSGYQEKITSLRTRISVLQARWQSAPQTMKPQIKSDIAAVQSSLDDLTRQSASFPFPVADTAASIISPAALPSEPYSPNWIQNIVLALAAGLVLGFAVAFIRERLDDRLSGREDLEEQAGAPVLAIIPRISGWGKKSATKLVARDNPKTAPAEAYRTIRTNLAFLAKTNDLRLITIASPNMGEGKTTTVANLAVSLAQTGKRVIAVSCDLRKPRLHRFFDVSNDRGVTSILLDGLSVPEVAQRVPGLDTLRVLASGPVPHNPAELLGSEDMEELLQDLRRYADFVLIDTAPVLVVSDVMTIAPKTDGVVLLVDATTTLRGAVAASREQLELVGANIVGAVFNDFDPARAKMYYGSYRYHTYGNYQYAEKGAAAPERRAKRAPVDPAEMWD
jgi:capsular exopolysaccharide synthesis family protein